MPEIDLDQFMDIRNDTELTLCRDCLFWAKLVGDERERCFKNAPKPQITSSFDSITQNVAWPAPGAFQGCFEGIFKHKVLTPSDEEIEDNCDDCLGLCSECIEPHNPANKKLQILTDVAEEIVGNDDPQDDIIEDECYDNP